MREVKAHLGLPHNGWTTRQLRPQVETLIAAGSLKPGRQNGLNVYALTPGGRRRAAPFRVLPESPQHRKWREARALAAERMSEFRRGMRAAMADARRLLNADGDAEAWAETANQLQRSAWRLSSATHCLREWAEPDDATADIADPELRVRRNPRLWEN